MASRPRVLVVDDKLEMAEMVADGLADRGFDAVAISSSQEALDRLRAEHFDALVTDLRMPGVDGLGLMAASKKLAPERPVLMMTAFGAVDSAIAAIREGAYHYLSKPFKVEELAVFLSRALEDASLRAEARALKHELGGRYSLESLVAQSPKMQQVLAVARKVAPSTATVLLLGETGTGKGHLARAVHDLSARASHRFISVNCAALPEALLESELFGHAKGAFTGATQARRGLFAAADGGTLFLDEVGEMSPALQAKLLHVLETGMIRPVGSAEEQTVDVRLIAATHRELRAEVKRGAFREDLLYRLEVVTVRIPPLRERRDDVAPLLEHYLTLARRRYPGSPVRDFSAGAQTRLQQYDWPGNVRELAHVVERLVLLGERARVEVEDLGPALQEDGVEAAPLEATALEGVEVSQPATNVRRDERFALGSGPLTVRELHHHYAHWVLERVGGNRSHAAQVLGIDLKTLRKWLADVPGPALS